MHEMGFQSEMPCIFTLDLADARKGWSQRVTGGHTADAEHGVLATVLAEGKRDQQEAHPLLSPGGSQLDLLTSPKLFSSTYNLLALCNFIWLQSQRRIENLTLEPSVEQDLLSSGVSAASAWGRAHAGRNLPCTPSLPSPVP